MRPRAALSIARSYPVSKLVAIAAAAVLRPSISEKQRLRPPRGQQIREVRSNGKRVAWRAEGEVALIDLVAGRSYEISFGSRPEARAAGPD